MYIISFLHVQIFSFQVLIFFQINSAICLLRGKIYDAMDNRPLATSNYKEALKLDVYCFEAFDLLTAHHMLTAQEGTAPLDALVFYCQMLFYNQLCNVPMCSFCFI